MSLVDKTISIFLFHYYKICGGESLPYAQQIYERKLKLKRNALLLVQNGLILEGVKYSLVSNANF